MKKKKRRPLTKDEILAAVKEVERKKLTAEVSPFSVCVVIANTVLGREGWGQERLMRYNDAAQEYRWDLEDGVITLEQLQQRIHDKGGFDVWQEEFTEADIHANKKDKFAYSLEKQIMNANNSINAYVTRYSVIFFNVLIDMGWGEKRLNRIMEAYNQVYTDMVDGKVDFMTMYRELKEKKYVQVELPNYGEFKKENDFYDEEQN